MKLPRIGINTSFESDAKGGKSSTRAAYWQAILHAGGIPILIPQLGDPQIIGEAVSELQGFVFIGGDDIPAERYGGKTLPTCTTMDSAREKSDFALLDAIIENRKPALAICLGFQELNVRQGGALYQDILFDGPPTDVRHYSQDGKDALHPAKVEEGSRLAEILEADGSIEVNSAHHQAVRQVGRDLRVAARAPDGLIEAVELENYPFFFGVQWHPERLPKSPIHRRLFSSLVKAANRTNAEHGQKLGY